MSAAAAITAAYPRCSPALARAIVNVAGRLGTHPNFLANAINFESGGTFSPSIRNAAGSGATGLIQFMPSTARGLGTTTDALAAMSAVQQMEWVYKYFKPYIGKLNTQADIYMVIFYPRAVGHGPNYSIYADFQRRKGQAAADRYLRQNGGIKTAGDYAAKANRNAQLPSNVTARGWLQPGGGSRRWLWILLVFGGLAAFVVLRGRRRRRRRASSSLGVSAP